MFTSADKEILHDSVRHEAATDYVTFSLQR